MVKTENNELFSSTVITIGYLMGAIFLPLELDGGYQKKRFSGKSAG